MATAIVWFRNNLRLHDNEALYRAQQYDHVIPIFVVDPRWFNKTSFGFSKTGEHRAQFLIETLENLRSNLQDIGSNLIIRYGKAKDVQLNGWSKSAQPLFQYY